MAPTCVICEKIKTRWPRSLSFGSSRSSSFIFPLASTIPCLCFAKPSLFSGGCPLPVLGTSACILSYLILSYLITVLAGTVVARAHTWSVMPVSA
jgi:hypothetical protein